MKQCGASNEKPVSIQVHGGTNVLPENVVAEDKSCYDGNTACARQLVTSTICRHCALLWSHVGGPSRANWVLCMCGNALAMH
jgi:hypothetical protein